MLTSAVLLAAAASTALAAPPNLGARWGNVYLRQSNQNGTNGSSSNGSATNGSSSSNSSSSGGSSLGGNDTQIVQFALNLEHLEVAFYTQGLTQFNDSAFESAGFAPEVRQRFQQILEHESTHVALLTEILGTDAPQPCNYTFPISDPLSFATLSNAIENGGESAYLGASTLIKNKEALGIAATILTVEGRQASWVASSVLNSTPWNGPFDTPLNASGIVSLVAPFISSCPSSNPPLPVVPLPALTLSPANATINQSVSVSVGQPDFSPSNIPIVNSSFVAPTSNGSDLFLAYYNGFNVTYSAVNNDNTTTIPDGLAGIVFASLVSSNETKPSPETTLSGLAVISIPVAPTDNNTVG